MEITRTVCTIKIGGRLSVAPKNQKEKACFNMSIQTFKRYEDKFLLSAEQFEALTGRLRGHMEYDAFCRDGTYSILNLYFDSPDHEVIRRSVSKPYYKEKLRLRSYGVPENGEHPVFLELKRKIGGIVSKRRAELTYGEAMRYLESGEKPPDLGYTGRQVLNEIDYFIVCNHVKPMCFLSYERIAMVGAEDSGFRITLDKNILARRDNLPLTEGCFGRPLIPSGKWLMEIKFSEAIPLDFAKLLSELKIYSRSFSKIGTEYNTFFTDDCNSGFELKSLQKLSG